VPFQSASVLSPGLAMFYNYVIGRIERRKSRFQGASSDGCFHLAQPEIEYSEDPEYEVRSIGSTNASVEETYKIFVIL
jgi:hypothetical protein